MKLITAKNLSVSYGNYTALSHVKLEIFQDDFLGVIGPNGGGKTTLIKAILGIIPYTGNIYYDPLLFDAKGNRLIGYLPQQNEYDKKFPISLREVILSGLQNQKGLRGIYRKSDQLKVDTLMELVGIQDLASRPIGEVSGGQMQRALLCRAIISEPKLLILDEPANFVDNQFEKELYDILKLLNKRMAIVMVSHDLGTISSVVKNIVCVNKSVHRHTSNTITTEQLKNYDCPIQLVYHGQIPHTVLEQH